MKEGDCMDVMTLKRFVEDNEKEIRQNRRYLLEKLADEDGNVKVYFSPMDHELYYKGDKLAAALGKLLPDDIEELVPLKRLGNTFSNHFLVHVLPLEKRTI